MQSVLETVYRVQRWIWRIFRPRTKGVKVLLFDEAGQLLLIRNNYGRSDLFLLPGGGIRPFESPEQAAAREIKEELGCDVGDLTFVSTYGSTAEGKRDSVYLFKAIAQGDLEIDNLEVQEARFYGLDSLPQAISPATRRRIEEHLGRQPVDDNW